MEFEKVQLGQEGKRAKRMERWRHIRRTLLYMVAGAALTVLISLFIEGAGALIADKMGNNILMGAFVGFFLTNSPCARGRC
ncbi:hypothetical protein [Marinoscillum sp.]|uniref:hypothetical protein n=1 Tax=Marinoscillum sp. TaxID=2024838 RepID=UPI003BAB35DE